MIGFSAVIFMTVLLLNWVVARRPVTAVLADILAAVPVPAAACTCKMVSPCSTTTLLIVITKPVWEQVPEPIRMQWTVITPMPIRGWNYADEGRIVDVMVVRKK